MLKFIKNIIKDIIKDIKKKVKIFNKLHVGDLVWAKMPLKNKELIKIPESHRVRPYLVIHKDFLYIYAYQTSSKKSIKVSNYDIYRISKNRYNKSRDSFVMLNRIYKIPLYNLKSKFSSLNLLDLKAIEKRLRIQKNRGIEIKFSLSDDIYITEGDVVNLNHSMYYIYSCDNVYLYGYRIFRKSPDIPKKEVVINRKKYYIDFNDKSTIKRDLKIQIMDIASFDEISAIIEIKDSLKIKKKKVAKKEVKIQYEMGTIFQAGKDKLVYLFEVNGIYYGIDSLMYQVFPRLLPIHNIEEKRIIDIYDKEKCKIILENLILNNVKPLKLVRNLYEEIR